MTYRAGDIVVLWERARPWRWYRKQVRERKFVSILLEAVWANFVRLISGPIHVGMLATGGDELRALKVYDSAERGVRRRTFWGWPDEIAVYRARNISGDQVSMILGIWEGWIRQGVRYGWVRNVAHFCDYVVEWVVWLLTFGWLFGHRPHVALFRWIIPGGETWGRECSNAVVAAIYEATGLDFGYRYADPGDIDRFCRTRGKHDTVLARTAHWRGP